MRSKLFVPGSRSDLFRKALASAADALSFDLEDAVEEGSKARAREEVGGFLAGLGDEAQTMVVRVNGFDTPHFAADLAAILHPRLDLLNVPKVESANDIHLLVAALEQAESARGMSATTRLLVNIETPAGLRLAAEIARASDRVAALQLGIGDLLAPLGITRAPDILTMIRLQIRMAAAEVGIPAYDTAFVDVADRDGFLRDAQDARRLGFSGKSCIHPSQIATANEVFTPSADEIEKARLIVAAAREAQAEGRGAFLLDGSMVDLPFIRRAQAVLGSAGKTAVRQQEQREQA